MMGVLGAFGWDVTVISSNFISLQLIITLAIVIHLVVRYREFQQTLPDAEQAHTRKKNRAHEVRSLLLRRDDHHCRLQFSAPLRY
jgi:hypothetical protein